MSEKLDQPMAHPEASSDHARSAIVQARLRSQRPAAPVWTEPSIGRPVSDTAPPVRDDALRLLLRLQQVVEHDSAIVVFAGVDADSGVSTATLEVARAAARASYDPVLVVDANFRRPALARLTGAPSRPGLADVVRGSAHVDDAIVELEPGSLYLMPAGNVETPATTLLASSSCAEHLRALRLRFSYVFADSAPLGAFVDGAFLAAQAQYVCLFVRGGRHGRGEVREIVRELTAIGVGGVGVCLARER